MKNRFPHNKLTLCQRIVNLPIYSCQNSFTSFVVLLTKLCSHWRFPTRSIKCMFKDMGIWWFIQQSPLKNIIPIVVKLSLMQTLYVRNLLEILECSLSHYNFNFILTTIICRVIWRSSWVIFLYFFIFIIF
jgi:hypothetical protein